MARTPPFTHRSATSCATLAARQSWRSVRSARVPRRQRGHILNGEFADRLAHFRRVRIEGRDDAEAAIAETAIAHQRLPHIADADQRHATRDRL